jgi:hypothetical protein
MCILYSIAEEGREREREREREKIVPNRDVGVQREREVKGERVCECKDMMLRTTSIK